MELTRLKKFMDDKKVRSIDLAQKSGLSFSTIQKARGGKGVTIGTATLIALTLKVKKEDLA